MIVAVRALDLRRVRVTFDAGEAAGVLGSGLYALTTPTVPSYQPSVSSARFINGRGIVENTVVELALENDLSPGLTYTLDFEGFGASAASSSTFVAYSSNWPPTRSFELWDVIPTINKAEDTTFHLERFVLCIQDQLDTSLAAIDNWTDILDPDRAPEQYLDAMLADMGNPFVFEDIYEGEKRLLLRTLVQLYQLKGTDLAIQAAVRLFMGFEAQINLYRQSGSLLGTTGSPLDKLNDTFVLGTGTVFDFALITAPLDPPGRALTATEVSRIDKLVDVVKPVNARMLGTVHSGLSSTERVQIAIDGADVIVSWRPLETIDPVSGLPLVPTNWRVYYRLETPGVSPYNSARYTQVGGGTYTLTITTPVGTDPPGSNYYFVLVPYYGGKEGFRSEVEVRNNLPAPTAATSAGPRRVTVAWSAVDDATSYKVYKTLSTTAGSSTPLVADFAFEVLGGQLYYVDTGLMPGQVVHYSVVARTGDSEGAYSASVSGTAL